MQEFKGTTGPWVASKFDRSIGPIIKDDDQSKGMILPVAWVEFNGKPGHQEADANLISAAPELLEALRDALPWINSELSRGEHEKALAAINKALGQ